MEWSEWKVSSVLPLTRLSGGGGEGVRASGGALPMAGLSSGEERREEY